jgi:hypothetical protein
MRPRDHKAFAAYNKELDLKSNENAKPGPKSRETSPSRGDALEPPLFRLPGVRAIAGVLVKDWAEGKITNLPAAGTGTGSLQKGNL